MTGPVPASYVVQGAQIGCADGRVKPGHDECPWVALCENWYKRPGTDRVEVGGHCIVGRFEQIGEGATRTPSANSIRASCQMHRTEGPDI